MPPPIANAETLPAAPPLATPRLEADRDPVPPPQRAPQRPVLPAEGGGSQPLLAPEDVERILETLLPGATGPRLPRARPGEEVHF